MRNKHMRVLWFILALSIAFSYGLSALAESLTEEDRLGRYEDTVTLTTVRSYGRDIFYPEGDDIYNNAYSRYYEDLLNVKVEYDWIVDESQYDNRMATMLVSGALPDFMVLKVEDYVTLSQNGALMDITQLHEDWAAEEFRSWCSSFQEGFDSAYIDGKLYGIPRLGYGTISLPSILWIRQDWLDEADLEAPKTMEELQNVALKFMEMKKGSYGLAIDQEFTDAFFGLRAIANGYGAFTRTWIEKDGKLVYGSVQPEMREALLGLQEMYKKGIIHKEFGVKDSSKVVEEITAGQVGITTGENWLCIWPFPDSVSGDGAIWRPFPVPTVDGNPGFIQGVWPITEVIAISKDCKNPEAVYKLINIYTKGQTDGVFGAPEFVNLSDNVYPAKQTNPNFEEDTYKAIIKAVEAQDPSDLTPAQRPIYDLAILWETDKNVDGFGRWTQMTKAYPVIQDYKDRDMIILDRMRGPEPEGYASLKATLRKLEDDAFTKIIMGAPIEEFDKFVDDWMKLGGEAATQEVNDMYNGG